MARLQSVAKACTCSVPPAKKKGASAQRCRGVTTVLLPSVLKAGGGHRLATLYAALQAFTSVQGVAVRTLPVLSSPSLSPIRGAVGPYGPVHSHGHSPSGTHVRRRRKLQKHRGKEGEKKKNNDCNMSMPAVAVETVTHCRWRCRATRQRARPQSRQRRCCRRHGRCLRARQGWR